MLIICCHVNDRYPKGIAASRTKRELNALL
jgi:hypothetical protein